VAAIARRLVDDLDLSRRNLRENKIVGAVGDQR
jgi:hypothetical protein